MSLGPAVPKEGGWTWSWKVAGVAQGEASANLGDSGYRQRGGGGERGQQERLQGRQSRDAETHVAPLGGLQRQLPREDGALQGVGVLEASDVLCLAGGLSVSGHGRVGLGPGRPTSLESSTRHFVFLCLGFFSVRRVIRSCFYVCVLSLFSCVRLFATPGTVALQAPLSMAFSRQENWSGLPFPPPGDLPNSGIEPSSLASPALQADSLPTEPPGKPDSMFK